MRIALRTTSTTPDYYGGCECAVVEVTPSLIEIVRNRIRVAKLAHGLDEALYELYFWGDSPQFFDYNFLEACEDSDPFFSARFSDTGKSQIPAAVDISAFEPARTECDQMIVRVTRGRDGDVQPEIAWTVVPKHTDTYVTTESLSAEELEPSDELSTR